MIRFGMALMEMVEQLTKGFIKVTGRQPDNLEKLKIQQEAVQRFKEMNKVVDMQGNVIDTSKGIMGGRQIQDNKEFGEALKKALMEKDNPYSDLVKTTEKGPKTLEQRRKEAEEALKNKNVKPIKDPEDMAQGGRAGFDKGGMSRRTFMKILGGLASIPIVGKILKPVKIGKTVSKVSVIKTAPVEGKPEWFDSLVNKVIVEGDDVTKKFATGERQSIHQKTLDDGSVVRVTEDVDDGAVRVEYESSENVFGDPVQMEYKRPLPDEATPDPRAEFTTAESGPVGRASGPEDYDIEIDEVGGTSISDLDSDVSKLKEYATGKKPTIKEMMLNKRRKDRARAISDKSDAQTEAVIRRQGDYVDDDFSPDFASGGIASMLGE